MNKPLISYAQNREDLILYVLLHKFQNGFYVDVGANDPVIDSVTKFFYDRGWHGINIEPIPSLYRKISNRRKRDINLNIAVSNKPGRLELREYGKGKHGWSTLSPAMKQDRGSEADEYLDYEVEVSTLKTILDSQKVGTIDFLKVDVEGFEYEVLSGNDWKKYRPKVIIVENTLPKKWLAVVIRAGYQQVHHDGLNRYFVRSDLSKVCTMDDYGEVLLGSAANMTAYQESVLKQLKLTQKWLRATQRELSKTRERCWQLEAQLRSSKSNQGGFLRIRGLPAALLKRTGKKTKTTASR